MPIFRSSRLYRWLQHVARNILFVAGRGLGWGCRLCVRVEGCFSTRDYLPVHQCMVCISQKKYVFAVRTGSANINKVKYNVYRVNML